MTAVPDLMVTLANGDQVPWSEFKTWSGQKQGASMRPKYVLSEQGRASIIEANKNKTKSAEVRAKISASVKGRHKVARPGPMLGKKHSLETRAKMSASRTKFVSCPEVRAKISATNKKHYRSHQSQETRAKIRDANLGKKHSPETRAKMSAALQGRAGPCKPIMTPAGVFPSAKAAIEWALANGVPNAGKKIPKWLVTQPDQYYYLPKDTK